MAWFCDGAVETACGAWSAEDRSLRLGSSVCAEPLAIVRAAVAHLRGDPHGRWVTFATDHAGMVFAGARAADRLYAVRCDDYFAALRRLQELWPASHFEFVFVAGIDNPVDGASRGEQQRQPMTEENFRGRTRTVEQLINGRSKRKAWML